jgi:hypothetical protein
MYYPGLEFYRVESAPRKYFRFHLVLAGTPGLADGVRV